MSSNQPGLPSETLPQNEKMAVVRLWPRRVGRRAEGSELEAKWAWGTCPLLLQGQLTLGVNYDSDMTLTDDLRTLDVSPSLPTAQRCFTKRRSPHTGGWGVSFPGPPRGPWLEKPNGTSDMGNEAGGSPFSFLGHTCWCELRENSGGAGTPECGLSNS